MINRADGKLICMPIIRALTVPDEFIVGYGLDFNEKYESTFLAVLKEQFR